MPLITTQDPGQYIPQSEFARRLRVAGYRPPIKYIRQWDAMGVLPTVYFHADSARRHFLTTDAETFIVGLSTLE